MAEPWIAPHDVVRPVVRLGPGTWHPSERPVVAARVADPVDLAAAVSAGADALDVELDGAAVPEHLRSPVGTGLPVIASTSSANTATQALAGGAAAVRTPTGGHLAEVLAQVVSWEASLVLVGSLAEVRSGAVAAANAGLPREQVVLEVPTERVPEARTLGWPVAVSVLDDTLAAAVATATAAVAAGAALLRTSDGRAARRTSAVMAAVLAARGPEETP